MATVRMGAGFGGRGAWRWALPAVLAILPVSAFLPVVTNGWVNWDDPQNFLDNPHFRGVGWAQLTWAFRTTLLGVYRPLAWVMCGAEEAAWGLSPRPYHLVSLALHGLNAVLLYAVTLTLLRRAAPGIEECSPGALRAGALVACALFAVHPLRTEVVAWVSAQGYLAAALLALVCVLAYLRAPLERGPARRRWLLAALASFIGSLLFHPTAIGLPLALLVIDHFPLRRFDGATRREWALAVVEKVPFVAVSLIIAVVAARARDSVIPLSKDGVVARMAVGAGSAWFYVERTAWPADLCHLYAAPDTIRWQEPRHLVSLSAVAGITLGCWLVRTRWPGALTAWLCYLILLGPNSGLMRYGYYTVADRYSYQCTMALTALLAGAVATGLARWRALPWRALMLGSAAAAVLLLAGLSQQQARAWQCSLTLWRQAVRTGAKHFPEAHGMLGWAMAGQGDLGEAEASLRTAVALGPAYQDGWRLLGYVLAQRGRVVEAVEVFRVALSRRPDDAEVLAGLGECLNRLGRFAEAEGALDAATRVDGTRAATWQQLGRARAEQGRFVEAVAAYRENVRLRPDDPTAHHNLGCALETLGQLTPALEHFQAAAQRGPDLAEVRISLGLTLLRLGRPAEAVPHLQAAVQLDRQSTKAHTGLGLSLLRLGRKEEGLASLRAAVEASPGDPDAHHNLGFALQQAGRPAEAAESFGTASRLCGGLK